LKKKAENKPILTAFEMANLTENSLAFKLRNSNISKLKLSNTEIGNNCTQIKKKDLQLF
jgi:hypothetical protein